MDSKPCLNIFGFGSECQYAFSKPAKRILVVGPDPVRFFGKDQKSDIFCSLRIALPEYRVSNQREEHIRRTGDDHPDQVCLEHHLQEICLGGDPPVSPVAGNDICMDSDDPVGCEIVHDTTCLAYHDANIAAGWFTPA